MAERTDLLASLAATMADYREGDLPPRMPEHVEQWVCQFDSKVQLPILREMGHVLKRTYFSRSETRKFLNTVYKTKKLVGDDPCGFWKSVKFLDIQGGGASQKEMLALFDKILRKNCSFGVDDCGDSDVFVYLDDAVFTGNRVRRDIEAWIAKDAPNSAKLHVICIALHSGHYYAHDKIKEAAGRAGKKIDLCWWRAVELENRKSHADTSDVLWPTAIPNDQPVQAYVAAMRFPPKLRNPGHVGDRAFFSDEAGRQLLETEFLKAGVRIRQMCPNLNQYQRPLGNMVLDTLGFGSLIVTFRNCPNNVPLALWAGDPWCPLFPRSTNSDTSLKNFIAMLAKEDF